MKRISSVTAALCLSLAAPTLAAAADNKASCQVYSKIGSTTVEFMLPLTLQEFVNMMTGKNPELLQKMSTGLLSGLDGDDVKTMIGLGEDSTLAGQAAGEVAVAMLMSGQASSASEVQTKMQRDCEAIGFDKIVENQKRANRATAGNIGK